MQSQDRGKHAALGGESGRIVLRAATGRKGAACVGSAVCCRCDEVKDHDGGVQTSTIGGTSPARLTSVYSQFLALHVRSMNCE
jgi:hypothetical protein